MQNGYVVLNTIVLLLIGIAGAGKTSFCHMLFDEPPPTIRRSTSLAQSSIRALSLSRAVVSHVEGTVPLWKRVSSQMMSSLIADGIKSFTDVLTKPKSESKSESPGLTTDEQSHTVSPSPPTSSSPSTSPSISDIDQLFALKPVKDLLELISQSKGSFEIFRRAWLYITDSGGQPLFHELLPTFVHHVSAVAFFVKLNETLATRPMIDYFGYEGKSICQSYQSSQTHLQIIQSCFEAMQSRCAADPKDSDDCPEIFAIGTHYDLESAEEPLRSKNEQLFQFLQKHSIFKKHIAYHFLGDEDQLIFPVNAKTPSTEDEKVVERFRQSVMEKCTKHQRKIPIRWFILESLLHELSENGVISFTKCLEVASRLGMDEDRLRAAIDYLVQLNMFEYFPSVLPQVVFTTSQVLLTKVTELVEYSHILRSKPTSACTSEDQEFRDSGYLSVKMLRQERFSSHFVDGLFEAEDLLRVLENRLVVTKRDNAYTMTSLLSELSEEKLIEHRSSIIISQFSTHVPIIVHYPGSLFPVGIFTSLVSYLQSESHWAVEMDPNTGKPTHLFKNCIEFVIETEELNANVTLIYTHQWIEVYPCMYGDKDQACFLRRVLFEGLNHAAEIQKYSHIIPKLAFFCPGEKGTFLSTKCNHTLPHLATATPNAQYLRCGQNSKIYYKLTEEYSLWIESNGKLVAV